MADLNIKSRTLWTGDNLDVMRGINSESVDLIYLDPPFNSNQDYSAPIGSAAAGAAFKDTWTLDDVDIAWHGEIAEADPALYQIIAAAGMAHGKGMQSYLVMMAVRLLEMRRVLKPTGSIYLHCDPTASHYLKMLMDTIFGVKKFWAAITWKRTSAHNDRLFGSETDTILMYGGSTQNWDAVRMPLSGEARFFQIPLSRPIWATSQRRRDLTGSRYYRIRLMSAMARFSTSPLQARSALSSPENGKIRSVSGVEYPTTCQATSASKSSMDATGRP